MWGGLIALAAAAALFRSADSQSWLHLAIGRSISEHGLPAREIGVLGARGQASWLPTWLFDLALHRVHLLAGDTGVALWRAAWAAATMALAIRLLFVVGAASWSAALIAPLVLAVARPHFEARPEGLAAALVLLVVLGLETARRAPRDRTRWLIPLQAAWSNLHGGWVIGPVIAGFYAAVEAGGAVVARLRSGASAESDPGAAGTLLTRARNWGALAVVMLGASALVPAPYLNLSRPLWFLGDALRDPITGMATLRPWTLQGQTLDAFNALLALALVALATGARRAWRACPALLGLTVAAITMVLAGFPLRELLAWVGFAPLAIAATPASPAWHQQLRRVPAALAAVAGVAWLALTPGFPPGIGPTPTAVPARATALADSAGLQGPVLNSLSAGGYIRWIRGDRHPPLIDSRGLGSFELRRLFRLADSDPVALDSLQEAWQFTHAIVRPSSGERDRLALNLSRRTEWALVRYDDAGLLFVRYAHYPELAYARAYRYLTPDGLAMMDMLERGRRDPGLIRRLELELERARRESPLHARASSWLGDLAQSRGDLAAAAGHLEEAARLEPDMSGLAFKRGLIYEALGERDKARRAYRAAMRDPGDREGARAMLRDLERR